MGRDRRKRLYPYVIASLSLASNGKAYAGDYARIGETKMAKRKWHESVTADRIMEACARRETSLDNPGICLACGNDQEGCEPDARKYECEACGERQVYGAEELIMMVA